MSRHPNYLGDWLMSVAWCLPSGIYSILTFFYAVYFAVLLVHRQMRDDHACKLKCASSVLWSDTNRRRRLGSLLQARQVAHHSVRLRGEAALTMAATSTRASNDVRICIITLR